MLFRSEVDDGSVLAFSSDGGATFGSPSALSSPNGAVGYAQLDAGGGTVMVGGSASDGTAWIARVQ